MKMLRQLCQISRIRDLLFFPKYSSAMRGKFNQSFVYSDIYNSEIHRPGKAGK